MKIAIITCSPQNDYARARSLRTAFAAAPDVDLQIIRNSNIGLLRYLEVMYKIFEARLIFKPDAYVITFRGYEMLLFMRLTFIGKPIIFDELVNFTEWMDEQRRLRRDTIPYKLFRAWYGWLVKRSRLVLADTAVHAEYSSTLNKLSIDKYRIIPVGTDESVFTKQITYKPSRKNFTVLYYGHMLALHGLGYVIDAALKLKDRPEIEFRLVGGKYHGQVARTVAEAVKEGAHISHESRLSFEDLPVAISEAGLTLGGPFGGTLQASMVITGKTYQVLACAAPILIGKNKVNDGLKDKKNCLIVPQADGKALAEAIGWAADHKDELKKIGLAGRKLYDKQFSQAEINKLVAEIVEEVRHG